MSFTISKIWLACETLMLKSDFDLVGETFVGWGIVVLNFRKFP